MLPVTWSPDGRYIASVTWDEKGQVTKVWELVSGEEVQALRGHTKGVALVAWSPDGQRIVSTSQFGETSEVKVWDPVTGQEVLALPRTQRGLWHVAWSPDGKRIVSASNGYESPEVKIWEESTGQESLILVGKRPVACHPDGNRVAFFGTDGSIQVCDSTTGQPLNTFRSKRPHSRSLWASIARSPEASDWPRRTMR
jgi:WD40 repeat protein